MDHAKELAKIDALGKADKIKNGKLAKGIQSEYGHFLHDFIIENYIKSVVETGICRGYSSYYILLALNQTGGDLISIDPNDDVNIIVPTYLIDRWTISRRESPDCLSSVLEIAKPALFVHDSLHTYAVQFSEYMIAARYCQYVASHDIEKSTAWQTFKKRIKHRVIYESKQFSLLEVIK